MPLKCSLLQPFGGFFIKFTVKWLKGPPTCLRQAKSEELSRFARSLFRFLLAEGKRVNGRRPEGRSPLGRATTFFFIWYMLLRSMGRSLCFAKLRELEPALRAFHSFFYIHRPSAGGDTVLQAKLGFTGLRPGLGAEASGPSAPRFFLFWGGEATPVNCVAE